MLYNYIGGSMQRKRIKEMEESLDISITKLKQFEESLEEYKKIQNEIKKLSKYYGSKDWYKDFDDYNNKKINIKAGVLSEDGIYNTIMENKEIAQELKKISKKILEDK